VLAAGCGVLGYLAISEPSPWTADEQRRHLLARPSCDAARSVGLAPAMRGRPGYWPSHDRDGNGIACEPYGSSSRPWRRWRL
jgi:hypothetical protein